MRSSTGKDSSRDLDKKASHLVLLKHKGLWTIWATCFWVWSHLSHALGKAFKVEDKKPGTCETGRDGVKNGSRNVWSGSVEINLFCSMNSSSYFADTLIFFISTKGTIVIHILKIITDKCLNLKSNQVLIFAVQCWIFLSLSWGDVKIFKLCIKYLIQINLEILMNYVYPLFKMCIDTKSARGN